MRDRTDTMERPADVLGGNDLVGSLRVASIFDICQFLLLGARSGTLTLFRRGGTSRLFFDAGKIVNAAEEPERKQGRDAAMRILQLREGGFRFRVEEIVAPRLIEEPTQNLLLEAARRLDEEEEIAGGEGGGEGAAVSREEELLRKQAEGESFQSLFSRLEKEVTGGAETAPVDGILAAAASRGADTVVLREGESPVAARGGRVSHRLPGVVRKEMIDEVRRAAGERGVIVSGEERFRLVHRFRDEAVLLRDARAALSFEGANFHVPSVDALLERMRGVVLLVAESADEERLLADATAARLVERGHTVAFLGERRRAFAGPGIAIHRAGPFRGKTRAQLVADLADLRPSRVILPELLDGEDAALLLDLARSGRPVLASLPGVGGADALRRSAGWFASPSGGNALSPLLAGVISLIFAPGNGDGPLPLGGVAPWSARAAAALDGGGYDEAGSVLEQGAGDGSLRAALDRLVRRGALDDATCAAIAPHIPGAGS